MTQDYQLDPEIESIEKLTTGIPGFDFLAEGGLPKGRATLLSGTAGSAKTVFACQFLVEGMKIGENGVFVTFEEPPKAIRRNMRGFGWDIAQWEKNRQWSFVDASPQPGERGISFYNYPQTRSGNYSPIGDRIRTKIL